MMTDAHRLARAGATALALLALAACAGRQDPGRARVEIRGSSPTGGAVAAPGAAAALPGARSAGGIVRYESYEAAVARDGDTVADVAARIGLSAAELGAYNGLQPDQPLRAGDELVLPPRPGGYGGTRIAEAAPAAPSAAPIETAPLGGIGSPAVPSAGGLAAAAPAPAAGPVTGPATGPVTATAAPAATPAPGAAVWSPAVAAAAIDRAGGAATTPERSPETAVATVTPVPEPAPAGTTSPGEAVLAPPPSSASPLPPNPERPDPLASPNLRQYQTPEPELVPSGTAAETAVEQAEEAERAAAEALAGSAAARTVPNLGTTFARPVDGPVAVPYNISATGTRNEGVDFAAAPGTPVVAAADGEVALVSQSLGGLGTIVLIRHRDDVLTVYGRVTEVPVGKGQQVRRGQQIGVVAPGDGSGPPRMHFEIRKGAESVDPMLFL